MPSLAESPDLVGFFSYSRRDDEHSQSSLSQLRARIYDELRLQLGRDFRLWQDVTAIPDGTLWEDEIKRGLAESVFFIPIVTPAAIASKNCRFEFESFQQREVVLGRRDLIFPIHYITVEELEKEERWRQDEVLKIIGERQYRDWRKFRFCNYASTEVGQEIHGYCQNITNALRKPWPSPEGRRRQELVKVTPPAGEETRPVPSTMFYSRLPPGEFVGRNALLKEIKQRFRPPSNCNPISCVVLHGAGGEGKTRAAVEFSYEFPETYCAVVFIGADTPSILRSNILAAQRSHQLNIGAGVNDWKDAAHSLSGWLERRAQQEQRPWLLIIDNIDQSASADELQALLGAGTARFRGGHVLITARYAEWPTGYSLIKIDQISLDDARSYLLKATKERKVRSPTDETDAWELARALGRIPSLLTYAAGIIRNTPTSFAEYQKDWDEKYNYQIKKREDDYASADVSASDLRMGGYPDLRSAATWQTSVKHLSDDAKALFKSIGWLAPEPIPFTVIDNDRHLRDAVQGLGKFSLITYIYDPPDANANPASRNAVGFAINSALQEITRFEQRHDAESLVRAARLIQKAFDRDRRGFVPHALSVLHFLHQERHRDLDDLDLIDPMARLAILALAQNGKDGTLVVGTSSQEPTASINYLTTVLGDFYEVEPLAPILDGLVKDRALWAMVQPQLLQSNNYVLRYAMAEAIADNRDLEEVRAELQKSADNLNEFELAGYALALLYARDPLKLLEHEHCRDLAILADQPCYCGRSILGDLLLNLVIRRDIDLPLELRSLANGNFWNPAWDFIRLDVAAIEAARPGTVGEYLLQRISSEVDATRDVLAGLESKQRSFLKRTLPFEIHAVVAQYFDLGKDPNQIRTAEDALRRLDDEALLEIMRFFFSHPIWSVAESAATVLSSIVEEEHKTFSEVARRRGTKPKRLTLIEALLQEKDNWRVQFGANEAAFAVRNVDPELFYRSVEDFYNHPICKIRGLCAENLISVMVIVSPKTRNKLYTRFKRQMRAWVEDEDCWVLEHVHRLFKVAFDRGFEIREVIDEGTVQVDPRELIANSRLLRECPEWFQLDRNKFLRHIESQKLAIECHQRLAS